MKSIKVMPDYECHALWHNDGVRVGNINPKELPISEQLVKQLYQWAEDFDETLNQEDPRKSGFGSPEAKAKFVAKGYELAVLLKGELEDIDVVYIDIEQELKHVV